MKHILKKNKRDDREQHPLWLVLHGAYADAQQAIDLFGAQAKEHGALLLAPQASRPCGEGFCWSFARDAADIRALLTQVRANEAIDDQAISLIGFSMGCTIGCWLLAQEPPGTFNSFAALSMGSSFEPWELDDGGIDHDGLRQTAATTQIRLAVDRQDPYRCAEYFDANLEQFRQLGFAVETLQPATGVHDVTDEMKHFALEGAISQAR